MLENFLLHVFAIVIVGYVYGKIFGVIDLIEWLLKPWEGKR